MTGILTWKDVNINKLENMRTSGRSFSSELDNHNSKCIIIVNVSHWKDVEFCYMQFVDCLNNYFFNILIAKSKGQLFKALYFCVEIT